MWLINIAPESAMRESPSELHKFINEWEMRYSVCRGGPEPQHLDLQGGTVA